MNPRLHLVLIAAAGLALSACREDQAPVAQTNPSVTDPALSGGSPSYPAAYGADRIPAGDAYGFADRARSFDRSLGRRRPDYAFRYQDEQPLAWRTRDDYSMYAEPVGGGYRDYYYAPHADRPYFVRDGQYGYGYAPDGRLAAVYDSGGQLLPSGSWGQVARIATDVYLRGQGLRRVAVDESYRVALSDGDWAQASPMVYPAQAGWTSAPHRSTAWRDAPSRPVVAEPTYAPEARHDNGRHLGWYKHGRDHGIGSGDDQGEDHSRGHGDD
jgi:hypothetical protein